MYARSCLCKEGIGITPASAQVAWCRVEGLDLVGEAKVRHFECYLDAAAETFERQWTTLYQVVFRRLAP